MGNRRMISKTVTRKQRFLQMPLEVQALYFHLIQDTDDDGVVEAFPVIRMIGASEDSLRLLQAKEFIRPLNDEMVYFVMDFHEQNTVRPDRKVNSVHIDLLRKTFPEIELVEPKRRADRPKKPLNDNGQPKDNQGTDMGRQNISQSKLSKDNISQSKANQEEAAEAAAQNPVFEKLKEAFGEMSVGGRVVEEVEDLLETHGQALVLLALDETILNAGKSIRYTRAILENWQGRGLKTVEQVKQNKADYQQQKQPPQKPKPQTREEWEKNWSEEHPF